MKNHEADRLLEAPMQGDSPSQWGTPKSALRDDLTSLLMAKFPDAKSAGRFTINFTHGGQKWSVRQTSSSVRAFGPVNFDVHLEPGGWTSSLHGARVNPGALSEAEYDLAAALVREFGPPPYVFTVPDFCDTKDDRDNMLEVAAYLGTVDARIYLRRGAHESDRVLEATIPTVEVALEFIHHMLPFADDEIIEFMRDYDVISEVGNVDRLGESETRSNLIDQWRVRFGPPPYLLTFIHEPDAVVHMASLKRKKYDVRPGARRGDFSVVAPSVDDAVKIFRKIFRVRVVGDNDLVDAAERSGTISLSDTVDKLGESDDPLVRKFVAQYGPPPYQLKFFKLYAARKRRSFVAVGTVEDAVLHVKDYLGDFDRAVKMSDADLLRKIDAYGIIQPPTDRLSESTPGPWVGYADGLAVSAWPVTPESDNHDRLPGFHDDCRAFRLGTDGYGYWWDSPSEDAANEVSAYLKSRGCNVRGNRKFDPLSTKHIKLTHLVKEARQVVTEIVSAPNGVPEIDYKLKRSKGRMSTELKRDWGEVSPTIRKRRVPGTDKTLVSFFAYTRDGAPTEVLRALKDFHDYPQVQHLVRRAAIYLARAIRKQGFPVDAVVYAPSHAGLSRQLAVELAARLGDLPVLAPPVKQVRSHDIGVHQRAAHAKDNFKVDDQPRLNGCILVADDYCTTGSTLVGIAANLYDHPDVTEVVAAGLTIHS